MKPVKPEKTAHVSGIIKSTDAKAQTVTLETGRIYHSEAKLDLSDFKSGDKVKVIYTEADGKMTTSAISLAV